MLFGKPSSRYFFATFEVGQNLTHEFSAILGLLSRYFEKLTTSLTRLVSFKDFFPHYFLRVEAWGVFFPHSFPYRRLFFLVIPTTKEVMKEVGDLCLLQCS